jgi:hypothetical protein
VVIFAVGVDASKVAAHVAHVARQRDPVVLMLTGIGVMQIGTICHVLVVIRRQR